MDSWEDHLAASLARGMQKALGELSFTRLVWLTENLDRVVLPFLRGDLDRHLKGIIPPMPLREINAEQYLLERGICKPPEAP